MAVYYYDAVTEVGGRRENQDTFRISHQIPCAEECARRTGMLLDSELQVVAVFDGVGGAAFGRLAALTGANAVDKAVEALSEQESGKKSLEEIALQIAQQAQGAVQKLCTSQGYQVGTTLVLLLLRGAEFTVLNIGDSPAFLFSQGVLQELTRRHNLAWDNLEQGIPWGKEATCMLMNYLGKEALAEEMAHLASGTLRKGDRLLLCSDGGADPYTKEEFQTLERMLNEKVSAQGLVNEQIKKPGADNATVVILDYEDSE